MWTLNWLLLFLVSMEEERARQEKAAKKAAEEASNQGKGGEQESTSQDVTMTGSAAPAASKPENKTADLMADLLLSFGHGNDLRALSEHIPRRCHCLLMSATISAEVEKLAAPLLHNPYILSFQEQGKDKDEIVSKNIQQYYMYTR